MYSCDGKADFSSALHLVLIIIINAENGCSG